MFEVPAVGPSRCRDGARGAECGGAALRGAAQDRAERVGLMAGWRSGFGSRSQESPSDINGGQRSGKRATPKALKFKSAPA